MFRSEFHKNATLGRILSGQFYFTYKEEKYIVLSPTIHDKVEADAWSSELYESLDVCTEAEWLELNVLFDMWSEEQEKQLTTAENDLKNAKMQLAETGIAYKKNLWPNIKNIIASIKKKLEELYTQKYLNTHHSRERIVQAARYKYLLLKGLQRDGEFLYKSQHDIINNGDRISENITLFLLNTKIDEEQIRELARTEPWRSMWQCARKLPIMNKPAIELNDEQRMLISWSQLYDSVYEHNECPPDFVIDYDDALDGWLLLQKDKRDREVNRRNFEKNNPKIANASEIFKKVNSWEELKIVENMNDNIAKAQKKMRMGYLKEKGEVHEQHMPDTRKEIMMLYNRKKGS